MGSLSTSGKRFLVVHHPALVGNIVEAGGLGPLDDATDHAFPATFAYPSAVDHTRHSGGLVDDIPSFFWRSIRNRSFLLASR